MTNIAHNKPSLDQKEIIALGKVFKSGWIIGGSEVKKFEEKIAKMHNFKYGVALNSGTAAIHLTLLALGIKETDEVILPAFTVSDPLNAINYTGAKAVLVDNEKNTFDMDVDQVKKKITKKTKAIIVPHMLGSVVRIDQLEKLGIPIINDCAQSLGATYKNKPIGSFGDFAIFSFYATKLVTTGQGGMILTNSKTRADFIKDIIDYNGRTNYKVRYNYPLTDIAAGVGNVQLNKLGSFIKRRRLIGNKYQDALKNKRISYFPAYRNMNSNYYRFILKFENKRKREETKKLFEKNGISVIVPINEYELLYNFLNQSRKDFPNAWEAANTSLSIPIYPRLSEKEVKRITDVLKTL